MGNPSKTNKKGSVLLAVLCFTTVMLALATVAMKLSMFSNTNSTANVSKTQADVTSENYLEQYISTFGGTYDDLNTIAGADKSSAAEINITLGSSTNVGDGKIYVYHDSGNIVVESSTTYGGQTSSSYAYFQQTSVSNPLRQCAIIANSGLSTGNVAMPLEGDMIVEGDPTSIVGFHNSGTYHSNCFIESNVRFDTGGITFSDVADEDGTMRAPQFFTEGYIMMDHSVTFTNTSSAPRTKDASGNYTNEDGFICTSSKFISGQCNIGKGNDPFDVYTYGAYLGKVSQTYKMGGTTYTNTDYYAIDSVYHDTGSNNAGLNMSGNLYCYKTAASGQDGNLFVNANGGGVTIDGEVFVQGNIYILEQPLKIKGLHISSTTKIYLSDGSELTDMSTNNQKKMLQINGANYSSSLVQTIDTTVKRNTIPISTVPSTECYQNASPNGMFLDSKGLAVDADGDIVTASPASGKTKNIAAKYEDSYNSWDLETIDPSDTDEVKTQKNKRNAYAWAKELYVDSSCSTSVFSLLESAIVSTDGNVQNNLSNTFKSSYMSGDTLKVYVNKSYRYDFDTIRSMPQLGQLNWGNVRINLTIILRTNDIVITFPANKTFDGKEKIIVDKIGVAPEVFCYFMMYNKNLSSLSPQITSGGNVVKDDDFGYYYATGYYGKGINPALKYGRNYLNDKAHGFTTYQPSIYFTDFILTEQDSTGYVVDHYVYGTTKDCRTIFLLPDDTVMKIGSNNCKVNATIYSPNSDWTFNTNNDQIYGAIVCRKFYNNSNSDRKKIEHIRYGDNSILGFVEWQASSTSETKLLYFSKS